MARRIARAAALVALLAIVPFVSANARAQEEEGGRDPTALVNEFLAEQEREADTAQLGPELPAASTLEMLAAVDSATATSFLTALRAQYDYKTSGFGHRRQVFAWQYYSSMAIFVMVVLIVGIGVYFSWVQFRKDLGSSDAVEATQISVTAKGITMQSSILGVIILVLSLVFFYLYLVYVYPIQEIL